MWVKELCGINCDVRMLENRRTSVLVFRFMHHIYVTFDWYLFVDCVVSRTGGVKFSREKRSDVGTFEWLHYHIMLVML